MASRQQKALLTKEKILQAAIELFREKKFNEVTVDDIIKKATSSKGAFYTHFKSKHDIFLERFELIDGHYLNKIINNMTNETNCKDKLSIFFYEQSSYMEKHIGVDGVRTIYEAELNREKDSVFLREDRPMYTFLMEIFEEGQKNGEFRTDITTKKMLSISNRMMHGFFYDWSIQDGSFSLVEEQEILFNMMIQDFMAK